ncbi:MAG: 50S ribosomal protein L23 [Candidatus Dormibacteria bacterium]
MRRSFEQILVRPVVSEKSYAQIASSGKYVFRCTLDATKVEIKRAVEEAFSDQKIIVASVNTQRVQGRARRRQRRGGARMLGESPDWKKAVVTLADGQRIEGVYEGV